MRAYPNNRILSSAQRPRTGAARIEGVVCRIGSWQIESCNTLS